MSWFRKAPAPSLPLPEVVIRGAHIVGGEIDATSTWVHIGESTLERVTLTGDRFILIGSHFIGCERR